MSLSELEKREFDLRARLGEVEKELAEARGEFEILQRRYMYVLDSPEAQEALGAARAKVEEMVARVEELRKAHDKAKKELEVALKRVEKKQAREVAEARKELPKLAQSFHKARCELLKTIPVVLDDVTRALRPLEEAVDEFYMAGERFAEALKRADELTERAGGWPFAWRDLKESAETLWRWTLAAEETPEVEIPEDTLELLGWLSKVVSAVNRLQGAFPPALMTRAEERRLEERARAQLAALARG